MVTSCDTSFETFVAAVKRLRIVFKDDRFHDFLASTSILAEHHGGEAIDKKILAWSELEVLGVEIVLNKGPLSYVEDDVQMPIPTPNSLIYKSSMIPEEDPDNIIDKKTSESQHNLLRSVKKQFGRGGETNIPRAYVKGTSILWKRTTSQSWRCGSHQRG